jgi:hypothetical protein
MISGVVTFLDVLHVDQIQGWYGHVQTRQPTSYLFENEGEEFPINIYELRMNFIWR